jgi:hypothetical protein
MILLKVHPSFVTFDRSVPAAIRLPRRTRSGTMQMRVELAIVDTVNDSYERCVVNE